MSKLLFVGMGMQALITGLMILVWHFTITARAQILAGLIFWGMALLLDVIERLREGR